MDLSKFKPSDWLSVGGGALFFVGFFTKWWKLDFGGRSVGVSGGHYFFTGTVPFLLFLAVAVLVFLRVSGVAKLPASIPWPLALLLGSALASLLFLWRFIFDGAENINLSRGIGLFLCLIGAAAATAGRVMGFIESGGKLNDLKDFKKIKKEFTD